MSSNLASDANNKDKGIYAEDDIKYRKARDFLLENNTFKAAKPKKETKKEEKKD